jgi:hypothetical protein
VPRKCNDIIIINNKIQHWLKYAQGQELYGSMIPRERELKGITHFIIFISPIIVLMERRGYMSLLGEGHVVLDSQVNI